MSLYYNSLLEILITILSGSMLRRALIKTFKRATGSNSLLNLNEPVVVDICMTCDLFQTLATTFTQLRMSIVAGKSLKILDNLGSLEYLE